MAPVYIVFSAQCPSPQFSLADLDIAKISFEHFSVIEFMWSLNVSFVSSIIPRYFKLCTCVMLGYVMLCYVWLCYVILCYVMFGHVMLYYII